MTFPEIADIVDEAPNGLLLPTHEGYHRLQQLRVLCPGAPEWSHLEENHSFVTADGRQRVVRKQYCWSAESLVSGGWRWHGQYARADLAMATLAEQG